MAKPAPKGDRRGPDRPSNGDVVACPVCNTSTLEFNARWRVFLTSGGSKTVPAWVCDNAGCRFVRLARREDSVLRLAESVGSAARSLRARAQRKLMKSRDVRERAERTLAKSQSRRNRN